MKIAESNQFVENSEPFETYKFSIKNENLAHLMNLLGGDIYSDKILAKMAEIKNQEIDRGLTLVGPHRDDLLLMLGDHFVKGYASHGESWSISLSLKLATYQLLQNDGLKPILILDDVFSELDEERREHLVSLANSAEQTLITVAVQTDLPPHLMGTTFQVKSGSVKLLSQAKHEA